MEKYIIGIDLDGTLLIEHSRISDLTKKIIAKVIELGHKVVISTGRPSFGALPFYKELGLTTPLVVDNGSSVLDHNGETIFESKIPLDFLKKIFLDNIDLIEGSFCNGKVNGYIYNNVDIFKVILESMNCTSFVNGRLDEVLDEKVHSFMCIAKDGRSEELVERFKSYDGMSARVWQGEVPIIEVYQSSLSKLNALKKAAQSLEIDFKNSISFGDDINDLEMIKGTTYGFAMNNAIDLIKESAFGITKFPNDKDGVAMQLAEFFNIDVDTI